MRNYTPIFTPCVVCGKPLRVFPSNAHRKRYCSHECRKVLRVTKNCPTCGKAFEELITGAERAKYCSRPCALRGIGKNNSEQAQIEKTCPVCSKVFTSRRSLKQKTCSSECANFLRGVSERGNDSRIDCQCKKCGQTFRVLPSRARTRQFCSRKCAQSGREKTGPICKCAYCEAEIRKSNCRANRSEQVFCNNQCYHAWDKQYKNTPAMRERLKQRNLGNPSISQVENRVARWLDKHKIQYERQSQFHKYYWADFKVGEVYIEVNGCYWHGCPEHFPNPNSLQKQRIGRDKRVAGLCKRKGISLLVIWEHDIKKKNFDALKSLLEREDGVESFRLVE